MKTLKIQQLVTACLKENMQALYGDAEIVSTSIEGIVYEAKVLTGEKMRKVLVVVDERPTASAQASWHSIGEESICSVDALRAETRPDHTFIGIVSSNAKYSILLPVDLGATAIFEQGFLRLSPGYVESKDEFGDRVRTYSVSGLTCYGQAQ